MHFFLSFLVIVNFLNNLTSCQVGDFGVGLLCYIIVIFVTLNNFRSVYLFLDNAGSVFVYISIV